MKTAQTGKYSVPAYIRALKPKNVSCLVKKIDGGYYVYEHKRVDDPKNPGKKKNATGAYLGVIDEVNLRFVPSGDFSNEKRSSIRYTLPSLLDYGKYALPIAVSGDVLTRLKNAFENSNDCETIYVISLIYFANHYVPARDIRELYTQSYLSWKYPNVSLSENSVSDFLSSLGNHIKERLKFEQSLIDEGSGKYNIDGHVVLCCPVNNELSDYGSKYQRPGDKQENFMMVYDAGNKRVISCAAFDGSLPDKSAVLDTLKQHKFVKARFRVDSGFYSEINLGEYRKNDCIFIVPVPGTTTLKKMAIKRLNFKASFIHQRMDSSRNTVFSSVQYIEYTVDELEAFAIQEALEECQEKIAKQEKEQKKGEKLPKIYPGKINTSQFPKDRVIVYKDSLMHDRLVFDYRCNIGDGKHTEEELTALEPQFGVILLRTNDSKATPEQLYIEYKDRWPIETFYNYVRNGVDFSAFHESDYNVQQGISFIMVVEGLIYASVQKKIDNADFAYVQNMSMDECIRKSGRLKLAQLQDGTWVTNEIKSKSQKMFDYFGVDVAKDIEDLNRIAATKEAKS